MREVLFRGKRTDNGEWVEGILFNAKEDTFIIPHGNEYSYDPIEGLAFDVYGCKVDPETVGQYTGLTDKNGVRIFEGDILKAFGYNYVIMWDSIRAMYYLRDPVYRVTSDFYNYCGRDLSVIGNIHDNPEILKGGGDNG